MPTSITGTVAWSSTISPADASARIRMGAADPTETYAYYPDTQINGAVYRLTIANQTWTKLYPNSTLNINNRCCLAVSPDGTRLWVGVSASGPTFGFWYDLAADGSSASPATAVLSDTTYSPAWAYYDPIVGGIFFAQNQNDLRYVVPSASLGGAWTQSVSYFYPPQLASTHQAVGPWRPDSGELLYSGANSLLRLTRTRRECEVLAGDGTTNASSTGSALSTPVGQPDSISSDADGRIYYTDKANNTRRLESGTVFAVKTGSSGGGLIHLPIANALLVSDGVGTVVKLT